MRVICFCDATDVHICRGVSGQLPVMAFLCVSWLYWLRLWLRHWLKALMCVVALLVKTLVETLVEALMCVLASLAETRV